MYLITNIAASREEGCWYHLPSGFSPESHTFNCEPWIAGMQLKLYEGRQISDEIYDASKDYLDELRLRHIVRIERISIDKPQIEEKVAEAVKEETKTFDLTDIVAPTLELKIEDIKPKKKGAK